MVDVNMRFFHSKQNRWQTFNFERHSHKKPIFFSISIEPLIIKTSNPFIFSLKRFIRRIEAKNIQRKYWIKQNCENFPFDKVSLNLWRMILNHISEQEKIAMLYDPTTTIATKNVKNDIVNKNDKQKRKSFSGWALRINRKRI